jgi:hypothetical protein
VVKVERQNVKMVYRDEVTVSFTAANVNRGHNAVIEIPREADPLQRFMHSALTTPAFKGDVQMVYDQINSSNRSS